MKSRGERKLVEMFNPASEIGCRIPNSVSCMISKEEYQYVKKRCSRRACLEKFELPEVTKFRVIVFFLGFVLLKQ